MPARARKPPPPSALLARPSGTGRKARRKRREQERLSGGTLLRAPMLRGHTAARRLRLLDTALGCIHAPLFRCDAGPVDASRAASWSWPHALPSPVPGADAAAGVAAGMLAVDVGVGATFRPPPAPLCHFPVTCGLNHPAVLTHFLPGRILQGTCPSPLTRWLPSSKVRFSIDFLIFHWVSIGFSLFFH